jgi:hypothetical protein
MSKIKISCDVCSVGSGYFEFPCILCRHNPKEKEVLLEEVTSLIKTQDNCTSKRSSFQGNTAPCLYCKGEKLIDLVIGEEVEKEVINVATSDYRYCPACGRKLGFDS